MRRESDTTSVLHVGHQTTEYKSDDVKNDFAGQGANIESTQRRFRGKRDINQRALFSCTGIPGRYTIHSALFWRSMTAFFWCSICSLIDTATG